MRGKGSAGRRPFRPVAVRALLLLASMWCLGTAQSRASDPLRVFVGIPPQKYFIERIAKDAVSVSVMVKPGANPATYEPSPSQMAALSRSRLYFAVGVPFERAWIRRLANAAPELRVVHTDRDIRKIPMEAHRHGGRDRKHVEGGLDPHVWLSPPLVLLQARVMLDALSAADPARAGIYENGYRSLARQVVDLDLELRRLFPASRHGARFLSFHPAWGYFARAYGLNQVAVEVEGKEPKPAGLAALIRYARKAGVGAVFVQPQFPQRSAQVLAREIGARVLTADPLAEDWAENLIRVGRALREALW